VALASRQFGPRVLTNFMRDRGNQITLGTFLASFLYCLVVLRTVTGGDSGLVPHIAVTIAVALAVASCGVLVFFIHHDPRIAGPVFPDGIEAGVQNTDEMRIGLSKEHGREEKARCCRFNHNVCLNGGRSFIPRNLHSADIDANWFKWGEKLSVSVPLPLYL